MKIYWNIVIEHVPVFSLQNNAWSDKQASLAPHSCHGCLCIFTTKTCFYSPSVKPAADITWCYDRKQIKHLSCSVTNELLNYKTLKLILATVGIIDPLKCLSTVRKRKGPRQGNVLALLLPASQAALLLCNRIFQRSWKFFQTRAPSWRISCCVSVYSKMADGLLRLLQLSYRCRTMSRSCQAAVTSNHRSGRMGCRCRRGGKNLRSSSNQSTRAVRGFLEVQCRCHSQELSFYTPIFDHSARNYDGNIKLLWHCTLSSFAIKVAVKFKCNHKNMITHESSIDGFIWIGYPWP